MAKLVQKTTLLNCVWLGGLGSGEKFKGNLDRCNGRRRSFMKVSGKSSKIGFCFEEEGTQL